MWNLGAVCIVIAAPLVADLVYSLADCHGVKNTSKECVMKWSAPNQTAPTQSVGGGCNIQTIITNMSDEL